MEKSDLTLYGVGATLLVTGLAALDSFLTNRKLKKTAKSVTSAAELMHLALTQCMVKVRRDGRDIHAISMVTPSLAIRK